MEMYFITSILALEGSEEQFNTCAKVYAYTGKEAVEIAKECYLENNLITLYSTIHQLSDAEVLLIGKVRVISSIENAQKIKKLKRVDIVKLKKYFQKEKSAELLEYAAKFELTIQQLLTIIKIDY